MPHEVSVPVNNNQAPGTVLIGQALSGGSTPPWHLDINSNIPLMRRKVMARENLSLWLPQLQGGEPDKLEMRQARPLIFKAVETKASPQSGLLSAMSSREVTSGCLLMCGLLSQRCGWSLAKRAAGAPYAVRPSEAPPWLTTCNF